MGAVVAKIRVLPKEDTDIEELKKSIDFAEVVEEKPFVFGLKVLEILVKVPDAEGGLEPVEEKLRSNPLVSSYEVLEIGRI